MLGLVHLSRKAYELAEHHYQKALELNRNSSSLMAAVGSLYGYLGMPEKGMGYFEEARLLDPFFDPPWSWPSVGIGHFVAGRYEDAIAALARSPSMPFWGYPYLAASHALTGRTDRAERLRGHGHPPHAGIFADALRREGDLQATGGPEAADRRPAPSGTAGLRARANLFKPHVAPISASVASRGRQARLDRGGPSPGQGKRHGCRHTSSRGRAARRRLAGRSDRQACGGLRRGGAGGAPAGIPRPDDRPYRDRAAPARHGALSARPLLSGAARRLHPARLSPQLDGRYGPFPRLAGLRLPDAGFRAAGVHADLSEPIRRRVSAAASAAHRQLRLFLRAARGPRFQLPPRLVLWGGAIGAFCWTVGVAWLVSLPDTVLVPEMREMGEEHIGHVMPDTFLDLDTWVQDVSVFFIVAALLALIVGRSRRLVFRQATLERERSNLARYFPPATVDRLARRDAALSQVREQDCAVLFVDLVAFTTWSERHGPREVIDLLREVHERLEVAVFEHEGTLDKFIGDGLMATFGTPDPGLRDATNAIACVRSVLASFEAWNRQRARAGQEPVRVSLGLHYGPVVIGDIGTNRRLEFAVLGDTVNVASRLEALTRELRCRAVVSAAVAEALAHETADDAAELLKDFEERGPQALRGRHESVTVWTHA